MTKTIAIALAITASLVGSESFAGRPELHAPGIGDPAKTLVHSVTVYPREGYDLLGTVKMQHGDRYLILVQDASPKNGPIGSTVFDNFELKLTVARFWNDQLKSRYDEVGEIDPGTGDQFGMEIEAGHNDRDMPHGSQRWYHVYLKNISQLDNRGPVKITVYNITPTIGLPPVLLEDGE
jgi:hypothetical protein